VRQSTLSTGLVQSPLISPGLAGINNMHHWQHIMPWKACLPIAVHQLTVLVACNQLNCDCCLTHAACAVIGDLRDTTCVLPVSTLQPLEQPPDLLEDTALPADALMVRKQTHNEAWKACEPPCHMYSIVGSYNLLLEHMAASCRAGRQLL
jgi:hypothetical protein